jgi:hypothetical protein
MIGCEPFRQATRRSPPDASAWTLRRFLGGLLAVHERHPLVVCGVLSLLAALLFALSSGEWRTGFHAACLRRHTDVQPFVCHLTNGTAGGIHPAISTYVEHNHSALVWLTMAMLNSGAAYPLAVSLTVVLIRTITILGLASLVYAATRRPWLAVLATAIGCVLPGNASVYGHNIQFALTGYFATGWFCWTCSLWLLGYRRWALACWLVHIWVHPTTFICWSPLFVGLCLASLLSKRPPLNRWARPYLVMLAVAPLLVGLAAGIAERMGLLPFRGDEAYWALVRVKACHSVFLFYSGYAIPLQYASQVAALFILALAGRGRGCPLRTLNTLAAFTGLGIGLMWAATVETGFSVLANMLLPLRFECVMYLLVVTNIIYSISCVGRERARESTLAAGYGVLLLFPVFRPIVWAWAWALGQAWLQSDGRRRHAFAAGAATAILLVCGYLVLGPSGQSMGWNIRQLASPLEAAGALAIVFAASLWIRLTWRRLAYAAACVACALIAPRTWITNPDTLMSETNSILSRQPESSAEKQACDWINAHIAPGTPVLVSQNLYLHRVTHVRTSVNKDIIDYFLYAPDFAEPLAAEMKAVYGIDVREMARRHERLNLTRDDWVRARAAALRPSGVDERTWRYVIEPAHLELANGCAVVFANSYVRIYKVDSSERLSSGSPQPGVLAASALP